MEKEGIYLVGEASVPTDVIEDVESYFQKLGDVFHREIIVERGPQNAIEWLIPTALFIFFAKSFLETLAKEMASDTYKLIKSGISSIWNKFFGQEPKYKYRKYIVGGRVQEDFEYSPAFSIYTELTDGTKVKFLYKQIWTQEEFDEATDTFLYNMALFFSGKNSELMAILKEGAIWDRIILLTLDDKTKKLKTIHTV